MLFIIRVFLKTLNRCLLIGNSDIMKLVYNKKFYGPIVAGTTITVPNITNTKYTHIGIQIPKKTPINKIINDYSEENNITTTINDDVDVNISISAGDDKGCDYRIGDTGILEFENLGNNEVIIRTMRDLPVETIIDVAKYER